MFKIELNVRDYECDMQGIVNNAVYQNYFEHARHEYLKHKNLSFKYFTDNNIFLVIIRSEIDYKKYLSSGDKFLVTVGYNKISKFKAEFTQEIYNNNILTTTAKFIIIAFDQNKKIISLPEL